MLSLQLVSAFMFEETQKETDSEFKIICSFFLSVAGTVAAKLARHAAAATLLVTAAPSASTKTGRGITLSAAQDFRLSPSPFLPSLQAGQLSQQPGCLLLVWPGSRPLTVCPQSLVLVERRLRLLLAPPLLLLPPQPLRPMDTRK